MANTGIKNVLTLRKYVNGVATSEVKSNTVGDPDYIAPYEDLVSCPIGIETTTTTTTEAPTTTTTTVADSYQFTGGTSVSFSNTIPGEDPKTVSISGTAIVTGSTKTFKVTVSMPFNYGNVGTGVLEVNGFYIDVETEPTSGTFTSLTGAILPAGSYPYTLTAILDIVPSATSGAVQVNIIQA